MTRTERGGAPGVEVVIIAPVILVFVALVVIAAQVAITRDAVTNAAGAAARAATQERTAQSAQETARAVAIATTDGSPLRCLDPVVSTDTSGFGVPVGQPAQVTVQLSCTAERNYLGILNGGRRAYQATSSAPLDSYRER
ncbi:ATP/GTP-binding protein [Luteococcus sp.]|uniref:ATP/GTP-binding protein n=1 Tax=Luteococcus sp. TaxID=1969402 RepID=UPI0037361BBF